MSHEINIADFAAFCRSKGDEAYDYVEPRSCALALFLQIDHPFADVGGHSYCLEGEDEEDGIPIPFGVHNGLTAHPRTFAALADRLEALIAEPVS